MYVEYFNIMKGINPGSSLTLSIVFVLIIAGVLFFRFRKTRWFVIILPFLLTINVIFLIADNVNTYKEYKFLKKALINKEHSVVEGTIQNFIPMDDFNPESFMVDNVTFHYRNDNNDGYFNKLTADGGPIKEGLEVRIFYYMDKIIGLWIKE